MSCCATGRLLNDLIKYLAKVGACLKNVELGDGVDTTTQSLQLFFDVESGLLMRRVVTNPMRGPLNVQWDFSGYRDVSGIKLALVIRTSDVASLRHGGRTFSKIKKIPQLMKMCLIFLEGLHAREMCVAGLRHSHQRRSELRKQSRSSTD